MEDPDYPKIYLNRTRFLLNLLNNPDRNMDFVHITGTAGKGSVSNLTQSILMASGQKNVGLFTSPYVTTSIEKIKVDKKFIAPDEFADLVEELKPYIDRAYLESPFGGPSFFEILFCLAIVYFAKKKCKYVVLEVACGGRYDATNVIEKSLVSAITNIDYDHMNALGNTLEKIAWEKIGIVKCKSSFLTTEKRPGLLKMFRTECKKLSTRFQQIKCMSDNSNEALASAIAKQLGISSQIIKLGITEAVQLPARFEILETKPLLIVDGAHNVIKMKNTVQKLKSQKFANLSLVIGISNDKQIDKITKVIAPKAKHIFVTRFQSERRKTADPIILYNLAKRYSNAGSIVEMTLDPKQALMKARTVAGPKDAILVTGSFFLAGELRQLWYPEEWILRRRQSVENILK
ncbi:MAG: hypothetical protein KW788_00265 [Candidatus Doudnabacteria bacterium]|nr:hypothetical protein [Candidatus Doudnabacteria bacterium]